MPDMTTVYVSNTLGPVRVCDMHPNHAQNALALILSNPDEAARQFSTPAFSSILNQNLHARASGLRYVVEVQFPAPVPGNGMATATVPVFVSRRDRARAVRRGYKAGGFASSLYRITESGVLDRVR